MSNIVIRPKDRAEWLEYRKDGIGSSEVATILDYTPFLWLMIRDVFTPRKSSYFLEKAKGVVLKTSVIKYLNLLFTSKSAIY